MALDGFKNTDDPGLRARLLQAGNAIGAHHRSEPRSDLRSPLRPLRMAVAEALTVVLITLIVLGWIVATP